MNIARAAPVDIITFDIPGKTILWASRRRGMSFWTHFTGIVASGSRIESRERFDLPVSDDGFVARQAVTGKLMLVLMNMESGFDPLDSSIPIALIRRPDPPTTMERSTWAGRSPGHGAS